MGERSYDIGGASCAAMAILHDAAALRDEVVLQGAVRDLENHLESSAVSVAQVVGDLFSTQRLLEFSLSGKYILSERRPQSLFSLTLVRSSERCGGAEDHRLHSGANTRPCVDVSFFALPSDVGAVFDDSFVLAVSFLPIRASPTTRVSSAHATRHCRTAVTGGSRFQHFQRR